MKKVFVSGCYDVLHAGHVTFFQAAKALGDHLIVCFANDEVLRLAKNRKPSMRQDYKKILISSLQVVDQVVSSSNIDPVFDFIDHLHALKPDVWVVTDDDQHIEKKEQVSKDFGIEFVVLSKREIGIDDISTTKILAHIKNVIEVPLRVDFAGGWLDVPRHAQEGTYIVNCTITPHVSLSNWPYKKGAGLGGSAAYSLLQTKSGLDTELKMGVGWQDPAVIEETGLCVWRSGAEPVLDFKVNPDWLSGLMMIVWTGTHHVTPNLADLPRDYDKIAAAGNVARDAVLSKDVRKLCEAVNLSYNVQCEEGMDTLPEIVGARAKKYMGGGHGGYALYIFDSLHSRMEALESTKDAMAIEPYIRTSTKI